jgi:alginate O-acetyltransferase complex protein AlgI
MLFNSYQFWIFFFAVFVVYRLLSHRYQNWLLLVVSYYFYSCWDWRFLPLILISTLVNFYAARDLAEGNPRQRKCAIIFAVVVSLGILVYFKYTNFFITSTQDFLTAIGFRVDLNTLEIILPVGISFYTFQTLSYTIDVARGKMKATRSLRDFALYVSYFPQLVAGPIERASHLLPQIVEKRRYLKSDFTIGLSLIMTGLFLKVVIADNVSYIANGVFSAESGAITGTDALVGLYAFAFQIYGDFAGYSFIACGVSRWLGIHLMVNFARPYLAKNPSDFWQRWHISLSTWLRDYIYIPLGGNRGGRVKTYRNLILTMLIGGLWHGAAWTFVVWGFLHGVILCIYRALGNPFTNSKSRLMSALAGLFFFHLVCLTWLFFRADSLAQAWEFLCLIFTEQQSSAFSVYGFSMLAFLCLPLMVAEVWSDQRDERRMHHLSWKLRTAAYCYMIFMLIIYSPAILSDFIYFQF